ncbi:MAG: hypothetical protein K8S99_16255 [Planctomycetes bacterium]|nr:hypothetical protein [Planctomycetota bacterium]
MQRVFCAIVLGVICLPASVVLAQAAPGPVTPTTSPSGTTGAPTTSSGIARVVAELMKEAQELDNYDKPDSPAHFTRPHPAVSTLGGEASLDVLDRMLQPFLGNEYRDTYIRWHLMNVVSRTRQQDRKATGPRLIQLLNNMPGPIGGKERPTHRYEPPDIASHYFSLANSANVVVGYPPFQRVVGAPESYKYMDPDRIAKVKANLAEAAGLRDKFKTIVDQNAVKWNERIRQVNYIIRQYRGELTYALIQTGDPEILRKVFYEVDKQAKLKNGIAFDLLAYIYLAAFDGVLENYPGPSLLQASRSLETTARQVEGYVNYGGMTRNFADYAFHLIAMLRELSDNSSTPLNGTVPLDEPPSPGRDEAAKRP